MQASKTFSWSKKKLFEGSQARDSQLTDGPKKKVAEQKDGKLKDLQVRIHGHSKRCIGFGIWQEARKTGGQDQGLGGLLVLDVQYGGRQVGKLARYR